MEDVQEICNCNGKPVVTFTLTLPSQIQPADLISLLRHARSANLATMPPPMQSATCSHWRNRDFTIRQREERPAQVWVRSRLL